ncbi:hypothetical protein GCM10010124_25430 [Pilimelia terevasa]|uniref:Uncharacterized protein n=1 Tax=Pilimelia terevasa TaxID=53372 RepID=A0A8J3BQL2_9ACTN|nr:hypothetical protein [Pilimelia terevasa]GGK31546.1 hypothetical protein GCM10010124_25430 [Pilimelia terevasa]
MAIDKVILIGGAVLIVLLLVIVLVRPWGSSKKSPVSSASPTLSASLGANEAAAADKALKAYGDFNDTYEAAGADPEADIPLKGAGSPLNLQTSAWLAQMVQQGTVTKGRPKHDPKVVEVNVTTRPYFVKITDCYDNNGAKTVVKSSGKDMTAPNQLQRYLVNAKAEPYGKNDAQWLISTITAERKTPC